MILFDPTFNIVFSILLLPINLFCSSWMFQEALKLSGMTFREFLNHLQDKVPSMPSSTLGPAAHSADSAPWPRDATSSYPICLKQVQILQGPERCLKAIVMVLFRDFWP